MSEVTLSIEDLEAMLNRAAQHGARAALEELGLHDDSAGADLEAIRSLLSSWKDTKKAIWSTVIKTVTTGILLFMAAAVGMYIKNNPGS